MLDMGIIKVEINFPELRQAVVEFRNKPKKAFESLTSEIREATGQALNQLMNAEMAIFLGNPDQAGNKRNGYETRTYALKGVGCVEIRMPIDRKRKFESAILPKGEQIDPRLKEDMAVLHLAGVSTRSLEMMSKRLLGVEVSRQSVSNSLDLIRPKAVEWLTRPIERRYWALYVDGTNFKIQRRGSTEAEPSLVVLGIDENNCKSILAVEPGTKDNVDSWRAVFHELMRRGLSSETVQIGIMDGLPGLEKLFKEIFPRSVTARCWVHAMRNAMAKTPSRLRDPFKKLADAVMYASGENEAKEAFLRLKTAMGVDCERAVNCLEKDLDSLLVHYRFERSFWFALKTTNPIERINKEFKKRSRSMGSMGESTLECLVAFIALQLEMGWRKIPVNSERLAKLKYMGDKMNTLEETAVTLFH
jgi:putative transposase